MKTSLINLCFLSISICLTMSCKTAPTSKTKEFTYFDEEQIIDLTTYDQADEETFELAKKELGPSSVFQYLSDIKKLGDLPKSIRPEEAMVLRMYTGSHYKDFNNALRANKPEDKLKYASSIKVAASGLNRLPAEKCIARRGSGQLPDNIIKILKQKKRFKESAFLSTSYRNSEFSREIKFVIHSDYCKKIDFLSLYKHEKEVLFPPGSEFIVQASELVTDNGTTKGTVTLVHTMDRSDKDTIPTISIDPTPSSPGLNAPTQAYSHKLFISKRFANTGDQHLEISLSGGNAAKLTTSGNSRNAMWRIWQDIITVISQPDGEMFRFKVIAPETLAWLDPSNDSNALDYLERQD